MKTTLVLLLGALLVGCSKDKAAPAPTLEGQWQMQQSVRTDRASGLQQVLAPTPTYNFRLVATGDTVRSYLVNSRVPQVFVRVGDELLYVRGMGHYCTIKELTAQRLVLHSTGSYQSGQIGTIDIDDVYTR